MKIILYRAIRLATGATKSQMFISSGRGSLAQAKFSAYWVRFVDSNPTRSAAQVS